MEDGPHAMTAPRITHMEWRDGEAAGVPCPNCGSGVTRHRLALRLSSARLPESQVFACDDCTCCFFAPYAPLDYSGAGRLSGPALAFYVQQGANPYGMARLLQRLTPRPRARLLEIGASFGFALDFATHGLGWSAAGFDPSPFAAEGRRQLGADIRNDYFHSLPPGGEPYDVLLCSEVVEHVERPVEFLRQMGAALRDTGDLVLTTPAAEALGPGTSDGALIPLLSPGAHHVLQSAASLERSLRAAGFEQVRVEREGATLFAWASRSGTPWRDTTASDVQRYRDYLVRRAKGFDECSDVRLGFLARAYRAAVGAGDMAEAEPLWQALDRSCLVRFGHTLSQQPWGQIQDLAGLAAVQPLGLGPLLLSRAHQLINSGRSRADVENLLLLSVHASVLLRRALSGAGADDGETELAEWAARMELMLLKAERGDDATVKALDEVCSTPCATEELTDQLRRRAFVALVNAGRYDLAFSAGVHPEDALARLHPGPGVDRLDVDVAFCFAIALLNTGDPTFALRVAETIRPVAVVHAAHLVQPLETIIQLAVAQPGTPARS
jgi:SAM-dependent methyltransferase